MTLNQGLYAGLLKEGYIYVKGNNIIWGWNSSN